MVQIPQHRLSSGRVTGDLEGAGTTEVDGDLARGYACLHNLTGRPHRRCARIEPEQGRQ